MKCLSQPSPGSAVHTASRRTGTGWHVTHCFSGPVSDHIAGLSLPSFRVCGSFSLLLPWGLTSLTSSQVPTGSAEFADAPACSQEHWLCLPSQMVWPQLPLVEAAQASCVSTAAWDPACCSGPSFFWFMGAWVVPQDLVLLWVGPAMLQCPLCGWMLRARGALSIADQLCYLESGLSMGPWLPASSSPASSLTSRPQPLFTLPWEVFGTGPPPPQDQVPAPEPHLGGPEGWPCPPFRPHLIGLLILRCTPVLSQCTAWNKHASVSMCMYRSL